MRQAFRLALLAGALAAGTAAPCFAQEGKVWTVGVLSTIRIPSPPEAQPTYAALIEGMRDLGYVVGKNLRFEWRDADSRTERLDKLARELAGRRPDVIVANSTPAARALQQATRTIPLVTISVGDPVGTGLVASLARPGGNVTGMANLSVEIDPKRLELLLSAIPRATRVAALLNASNPTYPAHVKALRAAAAQAKVELLIIEARQHAEIGAGFEAMRKARVDGVYVHQDSLFSQNRAHVAQLAVAARLPAIFGSVEYAEAGGLMSYGADIKSNFRHLATFIGKILKGAKPADLPMELPTQFELVINGKTAKAIGLAVPAEMVMRASRVIE